jgi:hypothetical protein
MHAVLMSSSSSIADMGAESALGGGLRGLVSIANSSSIADVIGWNVPASGSSPRRMLAA